MLSFCIYFLIRHPDIMRKAQAEVDSVLDDQQIQLEDLSKFPYLTGMHRISASCAQKPLAQVISPQPYFARRCVWVLAFRSDR